MGLKIQPGSFGVKGQKAIFTKMLFLLHIACYGHWTHTYSSAICDAIWETLKPATW